MQPSTPSAPLHLDPTHTLDFPETTDIGGAVFSPSGDELYVTLRVPVIDVGRLAVHHWPEIGAGLLALATVFTALLVTRVLRRPQTRNRPYCRRCNYDLTAHVGDAPRRGRRVLAPSGSRCPECGSDLAARRPVAGRSNRRRAAALAAILLLLGAAYAAAILAGVPRDGRLSAWCSHCSSWLGSLSTGQGWTWLADFEGTGERVVVVDPSSGTRVRTLVTRVRGSTYFDLHTSPDGNLLFLASYDRTDRASVDAVSTATGRTVASLRLRNQAGPSFANGVDAVSPDGRTVYIAFTDTSNGTGGLLAWEWATGQTTVLDTADAYGGTFARIYRIADPLTGLFLSTPHSSEAYQTRAYDIRIAGPGVTHRTIALAVAGQGKEGDVRVNAVPTVDPVHERIYVPEFFRGIGAFDIRSGKPLGVLALPKRAATHEVTVRRDGRFLFVSTYGSEAHVRDTLARRWAAVLQCGRGRVLQDLVASQDSRRVAAIITNSPPGVQTVRRLLLFDLAPLHDHPALRPIEPDPPPATPATDPGVAREGAPSSF